MFVEGGAIGLLCAGAATDLRSRRIPNALTFGGAVTGLLLNIALFRLAGVSSSLAGWALGTALLLIPFLLRAMGAGDVKLVAAVGAWAGPSFVLRVILFGALAGALIAVAFLLVRGYGGQILRGAVAGLRSQLALAVGALWPSSFALALAGTAEAETIAPAVLRSTYLPYGPALAIGGVLALLLGGF